MVTHTYKKEINTILKEFDNVKTELAQIKQNIEVISKIPGSSSREQGYAQNEERLKNALQQLVTKIEEMFEKAFTRQKNVSPTDRIREINSETGKHHFLRMTGLTLQSLYFSYKGLIEPNATTNQKIAQIKSVPQLNNYGFDQSKPPRDERVAKLAMAEGAY